MAKNNFNPNDITLPNGNIFGFPFTEDTAKVVILPIPWEVTTSYAGGTSKAPQAILEASLQLDFYDPDIEKAWEIGVYMRDISAYWKAKNDALKTKAQKYINFLEGGGDISSNQKMKILLAEINQVNSLLNSWVMSETSLLIEKDKLVGILGGEHSVALGFMKALARKYDNFSILQIDAHADLRESYEGFWFSHASIMNNALKINQIDRLVQVGVRDICPEEVQMIRNFSKRIKTFFDWDIKTSIYKGEKWNNICENIISQLSQNVYISFDIDGLAPNLCPNTGTPVPGGFQFYEIIYLLKRLVHSCRRIIGFDLCEISPGYNQWDANVGARLLYKLSNLMVSSYLPKN